MTRKLLYISFLVVVWNVPAFCQTDFDRLSREFTEKAVTSLGNESMITSDSLSLYVSKQTIGDAIVLTVNKAQLGVTIDIQKAKPIKDIAALPIRVPPLIKSCPHEEGACGSCEMHCSRFNVLCKGREAACAVGRDVCLAKNFAIEKGCQILKAAQDKLSKVDLAEFQFKDSTVFAKGTFNSTPLTINIQNNLKTINVTADHMSADVLVQGETRPFIKPGVVAVIGAVYPDLLLDCAPLQPYINIHTKVPLTKSEAPIVFETTFEEVRSDAGIGLRLKVQKADVDVETNLKPLFKILVDNPHLYFTCIAGATAIEVGGIVDHFFKIKIPFHGTLHDLGSFDVGEISISLPGLNKPLILVPISNELSLGVAEKK